MRKKLHLTVALLAILLGSVGCAGNRIVLKPENLFRDEVSFDADSISDYDALVFKSNGAEIYGQLLKPDRLYGKDRPCVILFHGFAGFARFDDIGQALCRAGCTVLIIHHRGAWGSRGEYSISNCVQDAVNLVQYVKSKEFTEKYHTDPESVFLIGHSMGGNTALNAAAQYSGVRGIVLLAPCDIGTMTLKMPKAEMRTFLIDNGLEVLKTKGFESLYRDLSKHAVSYAFSNAAGRLKNTSVLLVTGELDTCISNDLLYIFLKAARKNKNIPSCLHKSYRAKHGLMGVRVRISRDIADFILRAAKP